MRAGRLFTGGLCLAVLSIAAGNADEAAPSAALVEVRHLVDGSEAVSRGRVLVAAADGGVLLEERDGRLTAIKGSDVQSRAPAGVEFTPCTADELSTALLAEFGAGFVVVPTRRYVIVTNAGRPFAQYCGRLFERLQTAFYAHWKRDGLDLHEPAQPLVAVIFADPAEYAAYATADAGAALAQSQGYYSVRSNRIILADLTRGPGEAGARNEGEVQRRLEGRIANLVTVVHEATHQIAFNSGLHTRYADNPMWVTEGMAMYFEAPDLKSTTGWRTAGRVHPGRLQQFQDYVRQRRPANSLATLLTTEDRFRDPATMADAYAESWALTFYLIRERRAEYVAYLQRLGGKPRLAWDGPREREQDFRAAFGDDLAALERDFLAYMSRQRPAGN